MGADVIEKDVWIKSTTLGSKAKEFSWRMSDNYSLVIKRKFGEAQTENYKMITEEELEKVNAFVHDGDWTHLANSVSKLHDGSEVDGLGKFLYEELNCNTTNAQLASHIGAIFTLTGVWIYNGKQKGIQFKGTAADWKKEIRSYYQNHLGGQE